MNCIALSVEQHGPQHFNCIYLFILLVVSHVSFLRLDIGYDTIYAYARSTTPKYGVTHRFFLCGTTCGGTTSVRLLRGTLEDGVTHTRQPHTHPRALPPFRLFTRRGRPKTAVLYVGVFRT